MTQSTPILYWNIVSQPARSVKALLDIGKIPCKLIPIDLFKLQQKRTEYLKINPMGTVPTLIHNNLIITQSTAILVYLCQAFPQNIPKSYYGNTIQQRAKINEYLSWHQSYIRPMISGLFMLYKQIGLRQRKVISQKDIMKYQANLLQGLKIFNQYIGNKQYIANNTFTIADIMAYFQITILAYYGKDHYSYQNINRWFKNIYSVPQIKIITHQWFAVAQQMAKVLSSLPVKKASL